jgi:Cu/Ag efflux protein CusF
MRVNSSFFLSLIPIALILPVHMALAQGMSVQPGMVHSNASAAEPAVNRPMSEGEVKKVDAKAQTITLAHGPIKNLDMPAMTMAFKVKTPALLSKVKVGDKVKFSAEMPNGVMTVVALELR